MKLDDSARALIGNGADATLVTINPDGSPQVSVVWMALQSTPEGDELVSAHLTEYQKTRNIRREPRVAVTILQAASPGQQTPYLSITGTGGNGAIIQSDAGTLTLSGGLTTTLTTVRDFYFQGTGNGVISGNITDDSSNILQLSKSGTGSWALDRSSASLSACPRILRPSWLRQSRPRRRHTLAHW